MKAIGWIIASSLLWPAIASNDLWADSAADWQRMKSISPRSYVCYYAAVAPQVDGRMDDAVWEKIPWTQEFIDIEGPQKPRPRFRTRAKMTWDDTYLYIAAQMEEPHVWGTLTKHDSVIFHDNDFEVFIDPDGDNHQYYEFEMNALNTGWDLFLPKPYKDGGKADNSWDIPGLKTAVHVDGTLNDPTDRDRGWSVEIAIPWKVLAKHAHRAAPPHHGDRWRMNFSRVEWQHNIVDGKYKKIPKTREDNWVWSPQGIIDMHRPERWGSVQFSCAPIGSMRPTGDPRQGGRDLLMAIYHQQKSYRKNNGRWAKALDDLGVNAAEYGKFKSPPMLRLTKQGYLASIPLRSKDGGTQLWQVRQDSRIWSADSPSRLAQQIESVLRRQVKAWNSGDIDAFMQHYWKSERLSFSAGGKTVRGWQATRERYKRRYPTRAKMGELTFSRLEVQRIGRDGALVLGHWKLKRDEPIAGSFSLVFRQINNKWVIVHDHTSVDRQ